MSEHPSDRDQVRVRRAPKYPAFMIVGAGAGALAAFALTAIFPVDREIGFGPTFLVLALLCVPAGIVVGGVIALLLDRSSKRHAATVAAEHTSVEPPPIEGELED